MAVKVGSKYYPLYQFLNEQAEDAVYMTFSEIESMIGAALPQSARNNKAWWSNRRSGGLQSAAWMDAKFKVAKIDVKGEKVSFQRLGVVIEYSVEMIGDTMMWNGDLVKALREHMNVSQAELADEMGMRQQTISDWETGSHKPTRSTSRFLGLIAERAGFPYVIDPQKEA